MTLSIITDQTVLGYPISIQTGQCLLSRKAANPNKDGARLGNQG